MMYMMKCNNNVSEIQMSSVHECLFTACTAGFPRTSDQIFRRPLHSANSVKGGVSKRLPPPPPPTHHANSAWLLQTFKGNGGRGGMAT